ncbi:MAG: DsbA family protein [Alphaproteobacteria bacterium]|nr:DsbA family protein [Alphaproteobacteria bacterium]MCB9698281.1 DsbA family protein [Alphaproteobacteria bacterium]
MKNWKLAALLLAATACGTETTTTSGEGAAAFDGKAVEFEMYVMSQCPYGVQVENAIGPVKAQLGDALDLKINFIGEGEAGSFTSMHGPDEVRGDIVQLCAYSQDPGRALDLILCQNKAPKEVATNWHDCATEVGMDAAGLETCVNGDDGQKLLATSFEKAKEKGARGSPTMFINGRPYQGGRKSNDFLKSICQELGDGAPQACKDIPPPVKVAAVFLSDERCGEECDLHKLEPRLKGEVAGMEVKYLDISEPEGKELYDRLHAADATFAALPAVLFSADLEKDTDAMGTIGRYLVDAGEYKSLRIGAKWDPSAEICDNGADDDGDGKADCADDGCSAKLVCRSEMPQKLDLFVMSQCPYGAKAMIATQSVLETFGSDIDLDVHFIGNDQGGTLSSMHGPAEVDEDIREVCAENHYKANHQYMKYLACRSKDYKSTEWQGCATEAGMDPGVIQRCFDGEGKDLLRKSFAESQALGFGASPTFLANNRREFNAIDATKIQQEFCKDNPGLSGCSAVVQVDAAAAAPVPAGACGD